MFALLKNYTKFHTVLPFNPYTNGIRIIKLVSRKFSRKFPTLKTPAQSKLRLSFCPLDFIVESQRFSSAISIAKLLFIQVKGCGCNLR